MGGGSLLGLHAGPGTAGVTLSGPYRVRAEPGTLATTALWASISAGHARAVRGCNFLLKRVSRVRIAPGAQGVCAGQGRFLGLWRKSCGGRFRARGQRMVSGLSQDVDGLSGMWADAGGRGSRGARAVESSGVNVAAATGPPCSSDLALPESEFACLSQPVQPRVHLRI